MMFVDLLNRFAASWWVFMTHATWQASVTSLIILIIVWSAHRLSATLRYALLLVALAKFLMPPFLASPLGIYSQVRWSDGQTSAEPARETLHKTIAAARDLGADRIPIDSERAARKSGMAPSPGASGAEQIPDRLSDGLLGGARVPAGRVAVLVAVDQSSPLSWYARLLAIHVLGASVFLAWIVKAVFDLRRTIRRCRPATDHVWQSEFSSLAREMGISRPVRLLLNAGPMTPLAYGVWRPTVIVPESLLKQLAASERRAVLAHELAHLRRRDPLLLWTQNAMLIVWWFHPLAWLLNRSLVRVREQCCDDLVVGERLATREGYCAALVHALGTCSLRRHWPVPQMSPLRNRITRLLDERISSSGSLSWKGWASIGVTAMIILPGVTMRPLPAVALQHVTAEAPETDESVFTVQLADDRGPVSGTVVDRSGKPVETTVWLRAKKDGKVQIKSTATQADGRFRFANVESGYITLAALPKRQSMGGLAFSFQPGPMETDLKLVVTQPTTLELTVRDKSGAAIAGVAVEKISWIAPNQSRFHLALELLDRQGISRPKSDADGRLSIPGIPAGAKCDVVVMHDGYVREGVENVTVAGNPVSLTLLAGQPIVIRAVDGETGEPVPDATVHITGAPRSVNVSGARVGADGTYHTRFPVAPEQLWISVRHPELSTTRQVSLRDGTGSGDFAFRLYRRGSVRGRIVSAGAQDGCRGVQVRLLKRRQVIATGYSQTDGTFEIVSPMGHFELLLGSGNGYGPVRKTRQSLTVRPGEATHMRDLEVKRLPKLRGIVLMPDRSPAERALVVLQDYSGQFQPLLTDNEGRFEFQIQRETPNVHLMASHMTEGLSSGRCLLYDEVLSENDVQLQLENESEFQGSVVDAQGKPLAGVRVSLSTAVSFGPPGQAGSGANLRTEGSRLTDSAGRYRFPGLSRHRRYEAFIGEFDSEDNVRTGWTKADRDVVHFKELRVADLKATKTIMQDQRPAPSIECREWLNSPELTLDALRGKLVLLDFWATWCGPCVAELSSLQMAHELLKDEGLVIIGVHHNSTAAEEVRAVVEQRGLTFPIGLDTLTGKTYGNYNVSHLPTLVLIDHDGKVSSSDLSRDQLLMTLRRRVLDDEK